MVISIRARLTLYFTVLFGVIVVGLAVASYLLISRDLYSKLDDPERAAESYESAMESHRTNGDFLG